jgi:hypothetical protein
MYESRPYLCTEDAQTDRLPSTVPHLSREEARIRVILSTKVNTIHKNPPTDMPTHNRASINPNNEIKPRLQRHFLIRVPQDLEAVRARNRRLLLLDRGSVKSRDKAV